MTGLHDVWIATRVLLVLGAVVGVAWMALRIGLPWLIARSGYRHSTTLEVIDALPLGRNHRIVHVRWDDQSILVGLSPQGLYLLQVHVGSLQKTSSDRGEAGSGEEEACTHSRI